MRITRQGNIMVIDDKKCENLTKSLSGSDLSLNTSTSNLTPDASIDQPIYHPIDVLDLPVDPEDSVGPTPRRSLVEPYMAPTRERPLSDVGDTGPTIAEKDTLFLPTSSKRPKSAALQVWALSAQQEVQQAGFWRHLAAEAAASFLYMFVGLLPSVVHSPPSAPWPPDQVLRSALSWGLSAGVLARCFGAISSCVMNPAVTLTLCAMRRLSVLRCMLLVAAQCGGSVAGTALLHGLCPSGVTSDLGVLTLHHGLSSAQGLAVEILLSFLLLLTLLVCLDTGLFRHTPGLSLATGPSALTLGLVVTLLHLVGLPLTGCGVNPARALGPAVVMHRWLHHWIYWVGPLLGAALALVLHCFVFFPKQSPASSSSLCGLRTPGCAARRAGAVYRPYRTRHSRDNGKSRIKPCSKLRDGGGGSSVKSCDRVEYRTTFGCENNARPQNDGGKCGLSPRRVAGPSHGVGSSSPPRMKALGQNVYMLLGQQHFADYVMEREFVKSTF